MAETMQIPADAALQLLVTGSGKSARQLSKEIGRHESFISVYLSEDRIPGLSTFCEIANACGFDVLLVRGNEQVIVVPTEDK